ncbi:MAG TPA: ATP-dependent DNA ligase [Gaiellales bacterium]|nr:ATP-dependent DNA ligase [Gaiellales bacterium]
MALPLRPTVKPQLAVPKPALPDEPGWSFEPKLDGFRSIVFVDGDRHVLQSRNGRPLDRYFPELSFPEGRYVLDGELVIADGEREDFEGLQQRIHPAASRVRMLAEEMPASYVAFDLLALDDRSLLKQPFSERRRLLEKVARDPVILIEHTSDPEAAAVWLRTREGVVAKQDDAPYRPGERVGMVKVRRTRTVDAVVLGWRERKGGGAVGSLILGLYQPDGQIRHVGHTAGFTAKFSRELLEVVRPLETGEHGEPGPSRWSGERETVWRSMRPELVAEVEIEHTSGGRIRHGARLQRFRTDKTPAECTVDQLDG